MGKTPIFGVFALCLQHRHLCRSHYPGKAIQRLINRKSPGAQIVSAPKFITQNPRQLGPFTLPRVRGANREVRGGTSAHSNQSRQYVPFARSHKAGYAHRDSRSACGIFRSSDLRSMGAASSARTFNRRPAHISVCIRLYGSGTPWPFIISWAMSSEQTGSRQMHFPGTSLRLRVCRQSPVEWMSV